LIADVQPGNIHSSNVLEHNMHYSYDISNLSSKHHYWIVKTSPTVIIILLLVSMYGYLSSIHKNHLSPILCLILIITLGCVAIFVHLQSIWNPLSIIVQQLY